MLLDNLHLRVLLRDGQAGDDLELGNKIVGGTLTLMWIRLLVYWTMLLNCICCVCVLTVGVVAHFTALHSFRRVGYTAHSNLTASIDRSADWSSKVSLGQLTLFQQLQKFPHFRISRCCLPSSSQPAICLFPEPDESISVGLRWRCISDGSNYLYLDCVRRLTFNVVRRFENRFCFLLRVN